MSILDRFFNIANKNVLSTLKAKVEQINQLESSIQSLSDEELRKKTDYFRSKLKTGSPEQETKLLEELLPEAFAVMREAMKRVWGERHFDVQIIGGIVLHQGKIAEMKTGEGKTIVAALALYLNALAGRGAHLVTVNDYLAKHQGEGMGDVYNFLGLSTGIIQNNQISFRFKKTKDYKHYSECDGSNLEPCNRKEAYSCDIVYGTNNEFGFDYLRDNMAPAVQLCVQRGLNYAIVDEVDSILIDEARTPLIISAPAQESTGLYQKFAGLVPRLKPEEDYLIDEKDRVVTLSDEGIKKMEKLLGLENIYSADGILTVHHLEQALKAHALFKKDKDYIVKDGEIIIVDEFTGRLMVGRRYSEGLHQAIEAKEGVEVKQESQTMATISFQNLFRLYNKLAGMTGTAATEAEEFFKIYKLDVVEIPTNKPVARKDLPDLIYKSKEAKYDAIVNDVAERQKKGQPVLVGTVSVAKNELLSKKFKKAGIRHELLNAKNHEREAKIVSKAGQKGSVTLATNMAGRGTDIKLGEEIKKLGGLHVIGTERHESRRIDNQLRGRSGRQGDPGSSQFYVSMDDDLMRIFGGDRMKRLMENLGLPDDMPIENRMISRSIESAQRRVEGYNFDVRKHLVEYDDVMNKHREVIYKKRRRVLEIKPTDNELREEILEIIKEEIDNSFQLYQDKESIETEIRSFLGDVSLGEFNPEKFKKLAEEVYAKKENEIGPETMRSLEKALYLRTIDLLWVEHLTTMDELRTGIGLRGYGQRDPLVEYKQEAYRLFQNLLKSIELSIAKTILKLKVELAPKVEQKENLEYKSPDPDRAGDFDSKEELSSKETEVSTVIRQKGKTVYDRMGDSQSRKQNTIKNHKSKVGRNDPCPCGAKKSDGRPIKYKHCCGK